MRDNVRREQLSSSNGEFGSMTSLCSLLCRGFQILEPSTQQ